jgi:hypothetical protein
MMQAKAIMCTTGFTLPLAKYLALSEKVSFPFVRVCVPELSATQRHTHRTETNHRQNQARTRSSAATSSAGPKAQAE